MKIWSPPAGPVFRPAILQPNPAFRDTCRDRVPTPVMIRNPLLRFTLCALVGCLGLSLLCAHDLAAQSSPDDGSVDASIVSASGKGRRLRGQADYIGRAGLRANQLVSVTLRFPATRVAQPVLISTLDGGGIIAPKKDLSVAADGTVDFKFQADSEPGLYRVFVQAGVDEYRLEFFVLDTEHPEKNPPRVRIVD
jgi:hypothetical protein